uniref:Protein phosphatase 2C n=1 Tax=Mimivirus LCMiAC02 TaxID=2506609 RepID=A0A4D5XET5_9VIRU|nr:MAG: protein phosphatase 2C [Mimivirus LCMiAC02]
MGNALTFPILDKETSYGKNNYISFGCSGMQGYRLKNEDSISYIMDKSIGNKKISFFGVFDGHSGSGTSKYCSSHLPECIFNQENEYKKDNKSYDEKNIFNDENIITSFLRCDTDCKTSVTDSSGTTCISILCYPIEEKEQHKIKIICANIGDSRCVAYDYKTDQVIAMSEDHKPNNEIERTRIRKSGSYVEFNRVKGQLALSRAFGDFEYKNKKKLQDVEQAVIALPDIKRYEFCIDGKKIIKSKFPYQFVVLACDGIWDVMDNTEVCDFVKQRLKEQDTGVYYKNRKERLKKQYDDLIKESEGRDCTVEIIEEKKGYDLVAICSELLDYCVIEKNSKDNTSVIIVLLSSKNI